MNDLPASIRALLTTTVDGFTVHLDAVANLVEVSSAAGVCLRERFYFRRGFQNLPGSIDYPMVKRLEGAFYALVLPALEALDAHRRESAANEAVECAYATLAGLSAAARLFQCQARPAHRAA